MKILFYSTYFYPYLSGTTVYPLQILQELSNNHSIQVLTFPHQSLSRQDRIDSIVIIRMPFWLRISKGFISPQSINYFFHEAKKSDIIIINLPNFEGFLLAILAKLLRKKIISIFHCQVDLGDSIWQRIVSFILNFSVYWQLWLSNTIIAYPNYVDNLLIAKLFKNKIVTSLPPIRDFSVNLACLAEWQKEKNKEIWIGFAGRIAKEKGIEYLIQAVTELQTKLPIRLIFAGPYGKNVVGEQHYYEEMKNLLDSQHVKYRFLGQINDEELGAFYKAIDMLILPSINTTEAFGMVQAEAMKLGTPVISSNLPGINIAISLTHMGISVKPKSSQSIAQAIMEIINHKTQYTNSLLIAQSKAIFDNKTIFTRYNSLVQHYEKSTK